MSFEDKYIAHDEFYSQLCDVSKELSHYADDFKDKTVLCNCDDPSLSAFWLYLHLNFEKFGLKKLISTHYNSDGMSYRLDYTGGCDEDIRFGVKTDLLCSGDFREPKCINILKLQ